MALRKKQTAARRIIAPLTTIKAMGAPSLVDGAALGEKEVVARGTDGCGVGDRDGIRDGLGARDAGLLGAVFGGAGGRKDGANVEGEKLGDFDGVADGATVDGAAELGAGEGRVVGVGLEVGAREELDSLCEGAEEEEEIPVVVG